MIGYHRRRNRFSAAQHAYESEEAPDDSGHALCDFCEEEFEFTASDCIEGEAPRFCSKKCNLDADEVCR